MCLFDSEIISIGRHNLCLIRIDFKLVIDRKTEQNSLLSCRRQTGKREVYKRSAS